MKLETSTPGPAKGQARVCQHCGKAYHSPRASSLYCGATCRQAAHRKAASRPQAGVSVILKALDRLGMAGRLGPTEWVLTVPRGVAFAELALIFDRKGWGHLSEAEFNAALAADGVKPHDYRPSPKKAGR